MSSPALPYLRPWIRSVPLAAFSVLGCTRADVYQQTGREPLPPDRVVVSGQICTDDAGGSSFPVKVLLMVDVSPRMSAVDPAGQRFSGALAGLETLLARHRDQRHVRFGFVAVSGQSRAVPVAGGQRFYQAREPEVDQALGALALPAAGLNMMNALAAAESFITADIAAATAGEVLRTRYLVYFLLAGRPLDDPLRPDEIAARADRLRTLALERGALELRVDVGLAYYGPRSIESSANGGYGCFAPASGDPACTCNDGMPEVTEYCRARCDVDGGFATEATYDVARPICDAVASVGGGTFTELACPASYGFPIDVTRADVRLVRKDIAAFNRNVRLTRTGPVLDSDGDGLADAEEGAAAAGTDAARWDTDGDGLGDALELRTAPHQNPLRASDRPQSCVDPATTPSLPDRDLDLLNDCEEGVLSSAPSIPDTDGDGLPDALEFYGGTVPTAAEDRLLDFDADGTPNAVEVLAHTAPRANEREVAATYAYRNQVRLIGSREVAVMEDSDLLPGVAFRVASPDIVGGQAYLRWDACAATLEWSDARRTMAPAYEPVPIAVGGSGVYRLPARMTVGGEVIDEIWVEVFVTAELMPACAQTAEVVAGPLVSVSERTCYEVTVGNIKLMPTLAADGRAAGDNRILVFFTQAPEDRRASPGITRIAELRASLRCSDPDDLDSCTRTPADGLLEVVERDFVSAVP